MVLAGLWFGAPVYVDGDADCPGDGSSQTPYCSLQAARDNDPFEPGTTFRLRDAEVPYTHESDVVGFNQDGTEDDPFVLEPDIGHSPILRHGLSFSNVSHWVVRGLTFDGTDVGVSSAIEFFSWDSTETNVTVEGNTIRNWGGGFGQSTRTIALWAGQPEGSESATFDGVNVVGNFVSASRGVGISIARPTDVRVEDNIIEDMSCEAFALDDGNGVVGILMARGRDAVVAGNLVRRFDWSECQENDSRLVGVLLQQFDNAEVRQNWIFDTAAPTEFVGMGIATVQGTDNPWVHHNVLVNNGSCGLCDDVSYSNGGVGNRFEHNTIVGSEVGIDAEFPVAFEARSNLIVGSEVASVRLHTANEGLSWTFDNNLYDAEVGVFQVFDGDGSTESDVDFEVWKSECDCDEVSMLGDPSLSNQPEDYTPGLESDAVDLGDASSRGPFNGRGPDAGAFEAPTVTSAEVREASPSQIVVVMGGGGVAPLQFDPSCAGFEVVASGEVVALQSCEALGDGALALELEREVHAEEEVTLSYSGPWVRDSAGVGGVLDAVLPPMSIDVDNASSIEPPQSESTGGSTTTGGDDTDVPMTSAAGPTTGDDTTPMGGETGGGPEVDGGFPAEEGCGCRSQEGGGWLAAWCLVLLGIRRRRG